MASEEAVASNADPNFAVVCSFVTRYGELLGFTDVSISDLQEWLEDTSDGTLIFAPEPHIGRQMIAPES